LRILLDTSVILWSAYSPGKLSGVAREMLGDTNNVRIVSSVSSWELCAKYALRKLDLPDPPIELLERMRTEFLTTSLPLNDSHARAVCDLPLIHRDPFDRMLVCQALVHDLTIVTPDEVVRSYPVKSIW
jgi:PIN domain nuclease of toxin-antitoxin system